MNALIQDFYFAWRILTRNRGFAAAAIITLALGIGANTALFSLINRVLFSPILPFKDPERIVHVQSRLEERKSNSAVSGADYLDWRNRSHAVKDLAAVNMNCQLVLTGNGSPVALKGWQVTPTFFDLFGMSPLYGRPLLADEEKPGARSVVLSNGTWKRLFGSDPNIVGKKITLDGSPFDVVGVLPKNLAFIEEMIDVYVPMSLEQLGNRGAHYLFVAGRLAPGVTLEQANSEMSGIARQLEQEYPDNKGYGVRVSLMQDDMVTDVRVAFLILYGVVGFVLLIVCVNVANLLLARSCSRSKEMAVRAALGASRGRIIRQLLSESVLLAVLGGALGIVFAHWGIGMLKTIAPRLGNDSSIPMLAEISIDGRVLAFTALISILTGLAFGLVPALQASKTDLNETLKESERSISGGPQRHRFLSAFTTAEVALSLVLLVGAGLMVKSYYGIQKINPGFDPKNVLCVDLTLPLRYSTDEQRAAFYRQAMQKIQSLPGVVSVGLNNLPPMGGMNCNNAFTIEGRPPLAPGDWIAAEYRQVNDTYFQTMRVPLKQGRYFTPHDDGSTRVLIINESMADKYFHGENPLGQRLRICGGEPREIVGIVGDEKFWGLTAQTPCMMAEPYQQACWGRMSLLIRTGVEPLSIVKGLEQAVWAVDKDQPISRVTTMERMIAGSMSIQRFVLTLLCIFGGVALVLATIGVYGVMAYTASQRTHEIGIRMALGASGRDIQGLLLKQGLRRTALGLAIGLPIAIGMNGALKSLLHGVGSADPATLVSTCLILSCVALVACFLPARKASQVDPTVALRCE